MAHQVIAEEGRLMARFIGTLCILAIMMIARVTGQPMIYLIAIFYAILIVNVSLENRYL